MDKSNLHTFSDGRDVWNVEHLWFAARGLPVDSVEVSNLPEPDMNVAPDEMLDFLRRVMNAQMGYPILLTPDGRVADGRHRLVRARVEGRPYIMVQRFKVMPEPMMRMSVDPDDAFQRGKTDAYQDRCENVPFSSVGGLEKRGAMEAPKYIDGWCHEFYLKGYVAMCREMFGEDWQTCEFSWKPALTIGDDEAGR